MYLKIKNIFYNKKHFWLIKKWFKKNISFNFWKRVFLTKLKYIEEKKSLSLVWFGVKKTFVYLFRASMLILIIEMLSKTLPLNNFFTIKDETIHTFLEMTASVTGVFIGLYFTAISVSAGKLFLRANDNLRLLFMRNKEGQDYIQTLSLSAIISIYYLALASLGFDINNYVPLIMVLLLSYGIVRFMNMSIKAFYFLHPIETMAILTSDIEEAIKNVTIKGSLWKNFDFQNHHKKITSRSLKTFGAFFTFSKDNIKLSDDQYLSFLQYIEYLVTVYRKQKNQIPSNSYWYKDKQQFQNWMFANETEISLALNSGTPLNPKNIKNTIWVEEECFDLFMLPFKLFLENKNTDYAQFSFQLITNLTELLGEDLDTESYDYLIKLINPLVEKSYAKKDNDLFFNKWKTALVDAHGMIPISLLLGFIKKIESEKIDKLIKEIDKINWEKESSIYQTKLPPILIPELESIYRNLNNEKKIEGKIITPDWYIKNLLIRRYLYSVKKYLNTLVDINKTFYLHYLKLFVDDKEVILATQLNQRWLEYLNKLWFGLFKIEKHFTELAKFKKVKDLDWPDVDFDNIKTQIKDWEKTSIGVVATLLPHLSKFERESDVPDFFGQVYTYGVESCYQACLDNDSETFISLFPYVFSASLAAYDATIKNTQGWLFDSQISYSSEPLVDLLELSGYALIYAELFNNKKIWEACKTAWESYLSNENAGDIIKQIISVISHRESLAYMMPKAMLRSNRETRLKQKLSELKLIHDRTEEYLTKVKKEKHTSPLIRVISGNNGLLPISPMYAFFSIYLSKHLKAKDVKFPNKRGFSESLEKEIKLEETDKDLK